MMTCTTHDRLPSPCSFPPAVTQWRSHIARNVLRSTIVNNGGKVSDFITAWNRITTQQLGATLTYLRPANSIGLFQVDVPVSGSK